MTRLSSTAIRSARGQHVGRARRQIGKIADGGRDDIEAGWQRVHEEQGHGRAIPRVASAALRSSASARPRCWRWRSPAASSCPSRGPSCRRSSAARSRAAARPEAPGPRLPAGRDPQPGRGAGADLGRQCRSRPVDRQRRQPRLARHRRRAHPDHRLRHRPRRRRGGGQPGAGRRQRPVPRAAARRRRPRGRADRAPRPAFR